MARTHSRFDVGSGYYGEKTTSKTTNNNNNGNNNNNRERYRTTPRTIDPKVKARNDLAMKIAKQKRDAEAFKNYEYQKPTGIAKYNLLAQALDITGLGKKSHEVNKSYYERNVIGKINPKTGKAYSANIQEYKDYLKGRNTGDIDAMGRAITRDGDNNSGTNFVVEKNVGGKTILTTERKLAKDEKAKKEYDERTTKKRGRRKTIMTGSLGVTKVASDYSLGKPTLLGKV